MKNITVLPRHLFARSILVSSLSLFSLTVLAHSASTNVTASQQQHQATPEAKHRFIADYDKDGDAQVSFVEFFSQRQQRFAAMDLAHNAQVTAQGYQAEYADRLDLQLAHDRDAQLQQTKVRFAAVDSDHNGAISAAEYQQSGDSAFRFIDQNHDGVINAAEPAPEARTARTSNQTVTRQSTLVMPTTHSAKGMIGMYDQNQDGAVSPTEYLQVRTAAFERTDSDRNGQLSQGEYIEEFSDRLDQQIAKTRDTQLQQALTRFNALDTDHNGILSAPEYHQSGQRMFARWDTDQNRTVSVSEALPRETRTSAVTVSR
jgi:Ca2+-binding EF-hand superfamily protein